MRAILWRVTGCIFFVCLAAVPLRSEAGHQHTSGPASISVAPDLDVLAVEFGTFVHDTHAQTELFTPTNKLEMIPGHTYGWRMKLKTTRRSVAWVETQTLPVAPEHWGTSSSVTISLDRRSATTRATTAVDEQGYIHNYWIFSKGDPIGDYALRLKLEDRDIAAATVQVY